MAETKRAWTVDDVAARFEEAASTGRRLPPVRVQGYFNTWPPFVRKEWEAFAAANERVYRPFPPTPTDIERMLEAMRWVQWLEVEQRHLVWMRAERWRWYDIGKRFGVAPRTAQRHWEIAIQAITDHISRGG